MAVGSVLYANSTGVNATDDPTLPDPKPWFCNCPKGSFKVFHQASPNAPVITMCISGNKLAGHLNHGDIVCCAGGQELPGPGTCAPQVIN